MQTNIVERQYPLVAVVNCGIAAMGTGNELLVHVPPGGLLNDLTVDTVTAFNSATTATLTVSDGTTTFVSAVDVKTTGRETVANIGKYYPNGGTLTVSLAQTGADATAGLAIVAATYVGTSRANEVQVS